MNRFFYFFLLVMIFASCSEAEFGGNGPEQPQELVEVSLEVGVGDQKARAWYNQNEDKLFDNNWNTGDLVLFIPQVGRAGDVYNPFVVTSGGKRATIQGKVRAWSEAQTLYSIYPFRANGYEYNGENFVHDVSTQVVNVKLPDDSSHKNTDNSMKNSLLIARADDVVINGLTQNVDYLFFKQAMSFLRFTLGRTAKEHKLERVTIKDVENTLVTKSKVWINEKGEVVYEYLNYSNEVTATVEAQDIEGQSVVNFAVFPTTLKNAVLEIETVDKDGAKYVFTKKLPANLTFKRNIFNYFGKELDLSMPDHFDEGNVYELSSFTWHSKIPDGNYWIIKSGSSIKHGDLQNLRKKIQDSGRKIALKFPDVKQITGNAAFYGWKNLAKLEFPHCEVIGNEAFRACPDLTKVVMPALRKAGKHTFYDDRGINVNVEFIAATNPGIKLVYGEDGSWKSDIHTCSVERVYLTLGNKDKFEDSEIGQDYLVLPNGKRQYFGYVSWK